MISLLSLVAIVFLIIATPLGAVIGVIWAIREHIIANKYRKLILLAQRAPPQATGIPRWEILCGKKSTIIEADTEGEAVAKAVTQLKVSAITSIKRI